MSWYSFISAAESIVWCCTLASTQLLTLFYDLWSSYFGKSPTLHRCKDLSSPSLAVFTINAHYHHNSALTAASPAAHFPAVTRLPPFIWLHLNPQTICKNLQILARAEFTQCPVLRTNLVRYCWTQTAWCTKRHSCPGWGHPIEWVVSPWSSRRNARRGFWHEA